MNSNSKNNRGSRHIVFIGIFAAAGLIPALSFAFSDNIGKEPPSPINEDGSVNESFAVETESYLSDTLPLREKMLSALSAIRCNIFSTGSDEVIKGKNGFYFYKDEIDVYTGAVSLSDREVHSAARYLYLIDEYCRSHDIQFLFAPVPDKAQVYPEYLPGYVHGSEEKDLDKLFAALDEADVSYCRLSDVLCEDIPEYDLYLKTDTHWNGLGAVTAFGEIMYSLGRGYNYYSGAEFSFSGEIEGDLTRLLYPDSPPVERQAVISAEFHDDMHFVRPAHIEGNRDRDFIMENLTGSSERYDLIIETECPSAENGSVLVRRDSFGRALIPYFADNYKKARLIRSLTITENDLSGADDLVYEIVGRNIGTISGEPCGLPSPEREVPFAGERHCGGSIDVIENYDDKLFIQGTIDESVFETEPWADIILILKGSEDSEYAFEAYPSGMNGFSAYIPFSMLSAGTYDIYAEAGGFVTDVIGSADILP
ncbi:MAG: hypothetical protein SOU50_05320 [Oscillospiraceae bacterium]|nr:hypothetical protein [Oscillospiraceae bacterium]